MNEIEQSKLEMRIASLEGELAEEREMLRDRFAIAALPRIERGVGARWTAIAAYELADAMLEERKRRHPKGPTE